MSDGNEDLKAICRGNDPARGWARDEDGNWVPSLHDRRRTVLSALTMLSESFGGGVPGPLVMGAISRNSRDRKDHSELRALVMRRLT